MGQTVQRRSHAAAAAAVALAYLPGDSAGQVLHGEAVVGTRCHAEATKGK